MGKGVSKLEPLVSLCRERKKFIKAAKFCRYDFVSAFVEYIQSLLDVGNALNQYVEGSKICGYYLQVSLSDYEPSEEDSHLKFSFSEVESDTESLTDDVHSDMEVPRGPHYNFEVPGKPKPSTDENQYQFAPNTDKSYMLNRSNEMSSGTHERARVKSINQRQKSSNLSSSHPHHGNQAYNCIPNDFLHEDFGHHEYNQRLCSESRWEIPRSGHRYSQHMIEDFSGGPMFYPYCKYRFSHYGTEMNIPSSNAKFQKCGTVQNTPTDVPPTSPPPQVSIWDFLNPLSTDYNVYYDIDNSIKDGYKRRSHSSDDDVREIRKREGIPDLEDETEQSSTETVFDEKNMEREKAYDLGGGTFSAAQSNSAKYTLSSDDKELKDGKNTAENEIDGNSRIFVSKNLEPVTREGVNSEAEKNNESYGTSSVSTPVASYKIGLKEAVQGISDEFKNVFDCGKEFSAIIELGKLPHHTISTKLRAFGSCILGLIIPSKATHMHHPYMLFDQSSSRVKLKLLSNADNRKFQGLVNQKFGDLSSTLEQLYAWEKKLYEEVMCEEKLRIQYEKQCKRLKNSDARGAESDKIDDTVAYIRHLNSEINVAVASISAISREIHRLRDNKLLPELNKLIEGFIRLWKLMGMCHQKQLQAIKEATGHLHILGPGCQSNSRATLRLERTILNWSICFSNFVKTQKAFVKYLNEWLRRCILIEPEETADGIAPYSLGRIGAPPIFAVCNDWYHAIDSISEIEVCNSIGNFASSLHQLYEMKKEERAQKDTVRNLSKHQEVVIQVNDAASSCLQVGLSPIFEALGSFCSENLKIYEQLRSSDEVPRE